MAVAATVAFSGLFFGVPVQAAAVTANGQTCTYSAYTFSPADQSFNFTTSSCTGGSSTSASVTVGSAAGSLSNSGSSSAAAAVSCSGACAGVSLNVGSITNPASGVTAVANVTNGAGNVTVSGLGPLTPGSATIPLSASGPTGITVTLLGANPLNVQIVDVTAPGVIGFASATSSGSDSGSAVNIVVRRQGSGSQSPAASVGYTCVPTTGYAPTIMPAATGTFSWAAGSAIDQSITVTPVVLPTGATTGGVTCTLSNPTASTLGTATHTLSFTKNVSGSCATTADVNLDLGPTGQRQIANIKGTQIAAIKFVPIRGTRVIGKTSLSMPVPGVTMPDGGGVEVNIAECPGDFARTSMRCGFYSDGSLYVDLNWSAATAAATWQCKLDPTKTYYLNIRFVNPNTGITTCNAGVANCAIFTDWYIN